MQDLLGDLIPKAENVDQSKVFFQEGKIYSKGGEMPSGSSQLIRRSSKIGGGTKGESWL